MQPQKAVSCNIYRDFLRKARAARYQHLVGLSAKGRAEQMVAWAPILAQLLTWQKETTKIARIAREKNAGHIVSFQEARRLAAIEGWLSGGCSLRGWAGVMASEPLVRQPEPGGWRDWAWYEEVLGLNQPVQRGVENAL